MFLMTVDEITKLAIEWGPTAIFLLIFLGGTIWGLIRGFRKSTILAIHALVALAICLTGYLVIVNNPNVDGMVVEYTNKFLGEGWLQAQLGVSAGCETLTDCLIEFIPKNMDYGNGLLLVLKDNGAYLGSLVNMAYHIVFALLFAIIYLVLILILYLFFYHILYPERRYKRKKMRKEAVLTDKGNGVAKPYKKRRLLGGLVGATRGLVAGLVCMSFLGAIFFVAAGGTGENSEKADNDYTFGDENMDMAYDIYQNISHYGESGIFKILNSLKDKETQIPYYLFASELVFQGGVDKMVDSRPTNIALTRELTAYTKFARDTFDLVLKYDDQDVIKNIIKNQNPDADILGEMSKIMGKEGFQTEFNDIIDKFDANTYFLNLGISLIDSVAKHLDEFENLGLSEDVIEITGVLFNENYKSSYIPADADKEKTSVIKVSDILNVEDVKKIITTGVSILGLDTSKDDDVQKILKYSGEIIPHIGELTILGSSSKEKFNPLLERVYTYSVNKFLPKEDPDAMVDPTAYVKLLSETSGESLDWIGEINGALDLAKSVIKIGNNVYTPGMDIQNNYLDLLFNIFDEKHPKHTESEAAFDEIANTICTSSLLSLVLSDTGLYLKLEDSIKQMAPEAYFDGSKVQYMNPKDESGNPVKDEAGNIVGGEIYNLLTALKATMKNAKSKDLLQSVLAGVDTSNIDNVLELAEQGSLILTEGGENAVINSLLKSEIFSSVLSGMIISNKTIMPEQGIELYIPDGEDGVLEKIDGKYVNLIKDQCILDIFNELPNLMKVIKPYLANEIDGKANPDKDSVNKLIERLGADGVLDNLLNNVIVEGTLINTMYGMLSGMDQFVVMPDDYKVLVDETAGTYKANIPAWKEAKELKMLIDGIMMSKLDIDHIMKPNEGEDLTTILLDEMSRISKVEATTPATEKGPLSTLLSSNLLHYSVSGILVGDTSQFLGDIKLYITEDDYEVDKDGVVNTKLIKSDELITTLIQIPDVLGALNPFITNDSATKDSSINNLINRLNEKSTVKKGTIVDNLLEVNILHGTLVNALYDVLNANLGDLIAIPTGFKMADPENEGAFIADVPAWKDNQEIKHIFDAITKSGLNIDKLMNEEDKMSIMQEELKRFANAEENEEVLPENKPLTALLNSKILYNTLSDVLSGKTQLLGDVKLYVPNDVLATDAICGEVVTQDEMKKAICALPVLLDKVMPELEKPEIDVQALINALNNVDPELEARPATKVYESEILSYTLADQMTGILAADNMKQFITLPKKYLNTLPGEEGKRDLTPWFEGTHNEIDSLLIAVVSSEIDLNKIQSGNLDVKETINKIGSKTEADIEKNILASEILSATVSGLIQNDAKLGVDIIVPTACYFNTEEKLIKNSVIANLLTKVPTVLDNIDDQNQLVAEIVKNNKLPDTVMGENNQPVKNPEKLLNNPILMPTIVNHLNTNIFTDEKTISIPDKLKTAATEAELIKIDPKTPGINPWEYESSNLISALDAIVGISKAIENNQPVPDITNMDNIINGVSTLNDTYEGEITNLDVVYESEIMKATVGMHLNNNLDTALAGRQDKIGVQVDGVYSKDEMKTLVKTFNDLDLSVNSLDFTWLKLDQNLVQDVLASTLLKTALTVQLEKLNTPEKTTLIIPNDSYNDPNNRLYINDENIEALLNALVTNQDTLFTNKQDGKVQVASIDLSTISVKTLKSLISSDILYATASSQIIDMSSDTTNALNGVVQIPQKYIDAKSTLVSGFTTNIWKTSNELEHLVNGLGVFVDKEEDPIKDIKADTFKTKIKTLNEKPTGSETTNLTNVYSSEIMQATLTKQLDSSLANIYDAEKVEIGAKEATGYYKQAEVKALVDAFVYLEIDFDNPTFDAIRIDAELSTVVNASQVVKMALTSTLKSESMSGKIVVPNAVNDDTYEVLISGEEIVKLLNILNDNKTSLFNDSAIIKGNTELKTHDKYKIGEIDLENSLTTGLIKSLTQSTILNATTIYNIGTMSLTGINVPQNYIDDAKLIKTKYAENIWITTNEVANLVSSLEVFAGKDKPINAIQSDDIKTKLNTLNTTEAGQTESNLARAYKSIIIKSTLTKQLDGILTSTLVNPIIRDHKTVKDENTKYYLETEINNMLLALKSLGVEDINKFNDANAVTKNLLNEGFNVEPLFDSHIVWSIISDQLADILTKPGLDINTVVLAKSVFDYEKTGVDFYHLEEVNNLLTSIRGLNVTDINAVNTITSDSILKANIDMAYKSNIVKSILTNKLDTVLTSGGALKSHPLAKTPYELDASVSFYKVEEIKHLVGFIDSTVAGENKSFDSFDANQFKLNDAVIGHVTNSIILNATVTSILKDILTLPINVAYVHEDLSKDTKLMQGAELESLLNVLMGLTGKQPIKEFEVNTITPTMLSEDLLANIVMRANITPLVKVGTGLVVDSNQIESTQDFEGNNILILSGTELSNLKNAISEAGKEGFEFTLTTEDILGFATKPNKIKTIMASSILQGVISNLMYNKDIMIPVGKSSVTFNYSKINIKSNITEITINDGTNEVPYTFTNNKLNVTPTLVRSLESGELIKNYSMLTFEDMIAFSTIITSKQDIMDNFILDKYKGAYAVDPVQLSGVVGIALAFNTVTLTVGTTPSVYFITKVVDTDSGSTITFMIGNVENTLTITNGTPNTISYNDRTYKFKSI